MEKILRLERTMDQVNKESFVFRIFADLWPVLQPLDLEIVFFTFFKYCLIFPIFGPVPVGFQS